MYLTTFGKDYAKIISPTSATFSKFLWRKWSEDEDWLAHRVDDVVDVEQRLGFVAACVMKSVDMEIHPQFVHIRINSFILRAN